MRGDAIWRRKFRPLTGRSVLENEFEREQFHIAEVP